MEIINILLANNLELYSIRLILAFLGMSILTYYDIRNNKNVPANLCYAFLILAILFNLIGYFLGILSINSILQAIIFAFVFGLFLLVFYFAGQIGGADVIAIVSLALLLHGYAEPLIKLNYQASSFPIKLPLIFTILLYSFFAFVLFMLYKFVPLMIKKFKENKFKLEKPKILIALIYIVLYATILFLLLSLPVAFNFLTILAFSIAGLASVFYSLFRSEIELTLVSELSLKDIVEEDVLAIQYLDQELVKKYKLQKLLHDKELKKLHEIARKEGIKKFPIYTGYPAFMPFLLLGLILTILIGNIFM
ncbi:MAG: hypothetical protein QXF76_01090 [Candidatus Anstonellales archaeon]